MSEKAEVVIEKMISMFSDYRESFGVSQEMLEEFEQGFVKLVCEYKGHNMVPDHCGKPEHDYCTCCEVRRDELEVS